MTTAPVSRLDRGAWPLPVRGEEYDRPDEGLVRQFDAITSATACAKLSSMGVCRTFVEGPRPLVGGRHVAGAALTLQFMPQREDVASGTAQEDVERDTALWAVLESVQDGDVLVVQAYGSAFTGCLGDMLVRYFQRRGGAGIIVDGRVRDSGRLRALGVPIWCTGVTPCFASQSELFPWAYDVPVAVGGVLCLPGDVVVADDDGPVVVPAGLARDVLDSAAEHEDWERFSRMRLDQGARLSDYYPLSGNSRAEYEAWCDAGRPEGGVPQEARAR
jgi:regulator of RNase E activity RraA